jgi:4-hydroxy-3-methylbut-2-en-1-yl diphosphate synthase IspG/GcpE
MRHLAAVALLAALVAPLTGCGRETRHDVRQSIEQLSSIAAEGSIMGADLSRGRSKTTYLRVHGEELSSQAEHEAEKLNDAPVDPDLHARIDQAIQLSSDIGGAIDDMRVDPGNRELARKSAHDLHQWADKARKIAETM